MQDRVQPGIAAYRVAAEQPCRQHVQRDRALAAQAVFAAMADQVVDFTVERFRRRIGLREMLGEVALDVRALVRRADRRHLLALELEHPGALLRPCLSRRWPACRAARRPGRRGRRPRTDAHTPELQSLMRTSYADF